ncbi:MAG: hypothetical protein H8D43_02225 [Chloroflexi bacterium]|nr:hypothetical protein [Chloroflexota bacterium]
MSLESEAILIYRIWEPCPPKRSILRHFRRHIRLKPLSGYRPVCLAADWDDNLYVAYGKEDGQGYVETYQSDGQPVAWEEGQDKWELQGYPKALVVHRGQRREEREVFVLLVACSADEHQYTVCWRDILPSDCSADLAADPVGGTFMSLNNGRPRLLRVDRLGVDNGKSGTINLPQDQGKELAARSLATMSRPQEMTELFALSKKGVHVTELPKGRLDAEWADMLSGQGYHVYATDKPKPCIYVSGRQHVHAFKRSGNQGGWSNRWSLHVGHYETLAIGTHWLYLLRQEQDTHRIDRYWLRGYWRLYILLHDFGVLAAEWQGNT